MNQKEIQELKNSKIWHQDFKDWDDILERGILKCELIPEENKALVSILRTSKLLEDAISKILEKYNLSIPQKSVLESLYFCPEKHMTQNELAKYIFSTKSNISTLLNRMEEKNLIERYQKDSKKEKNVRITKEGKKLIEKVFFETSSRKNTIIENEKDAKKMTKDLKKIRDNLKKALEELK